MECNYAKARKTAILAFERDFLVDILAFTRGNVSQAARVSGIDRVYLHRLIRRHGLHEHTQGPIRPPSNQKLIKSAAPVDQKALYPTAENSSENPSVSEDQEVQKEAIT